MLNPSSPSKQTEKHKNQQSPLDQLACLRRSLMTDEDTRPSVNGVLTVCIKDFHTLEVQGVGHSNISKGCYCTISLRNLTKNTHVVSKQNGIYAWNQTKHFAVIISKNRKHPFNLVKIHVSQVSNPNIDLQSTSLGSISFHLHDIISVSPIASSFDVWDQHRLVGTISVELTFNYGAFGYGYSPQLKEEKRSASEMIACSLFPRITPTGPQADAVPHPSYIPFSEKVLLSYGRDLGDIGDHKQYVPGVIAKDLSHLEAVRDQYASMTDRVERVLFLHNHINGANQSPEVILDQHDPPVTPPRIQPMYVQPFNLNSSIKDNVLFRAFEKRRELVNKEPAALHNPSPLPPSPKRTKGPRTRAVMFTNPNDGI